MLDRLWFNIQNFPFNAHYQNIVNSFKLACQDGKERTAEVMMPNKNILQRSIIHLYPLERNAEKESNERPNKVNSIQKVSCKGE